MECDRKSSDNNTQTATCGIGNPLLGKSKVSGSFVVLLWFRWIYIKHNNQVFIVSSYTGGDRLREVVAIRELTVDVRSSTRPTESVNKIKSIQMELERIKF